jgi:hypothetical protein
MHFESLRLIVTEQDVNELMSRFFPPQDKIGSLRAALLPHGLRITGIYRTVVAIPFETRWELFVQENKIAARLRALKCGILSLSLARGFVLEAIAATARRLEKREDVLLLDVDGLLREHGVPLEVNLRSARCEAGALVLESGRRETSGAAS